MASAILGRAKAIVTSIRPIFEKLAIRAIPTLPKTIHVCLALSAINLASKIGYCKLF
jgi:hypothetical protein